MVNSSVNSSSISGWRQYPTRYSLEGFACTVCEKVYMPKSFLCTCGSRDFKLFKFSGLGKLISFTSITSPCIEFKQMPAYCIGLVQLDEGPKITVALADVNLCDLKIGMLVQSTFRKFYSHGTNGIIEYGLKFIPVL
jgi:uncharacterized OB-fold protein